MPEGCSNEIALGPELIDLAQTFFQSYNLHDVNRMIDLCDQDAYVRYLPMGDEGEGTVDRVARQIWSSILEAFPDLHVIVRSIFTDGRNVAAEVDIGGSQRKDFYGIPNRGRHYDLPHAFVLQFNDQRLIGMITAYWDNLSFYSQLGALDLPKAA